MDLNRLRIFVRVVEDGSFTAAARTLDLPKSSVSRSLTALEKALGVRLLQRSTRAMHLTDAGQQYFAQVRPALAALADSSAAVRSRGVEPRGVVRASFPPGTDELVTGVVARFQKRYPLVRLDLSFSSGHADLVAEGFDFALRGGVLKDSSLVVRRIQETALGLFASPSYLRRRGTPRTLAELAKHDCISFNQGGGRAWWSMSGPGGAEASVEVTCTLNTDLLPFAARAAAHGLGIALLPEETTVLLGTLVRVLPRYQQRGNTLSIVSPSRAFESRAVTLFKDALADELNRRSARCAPPAAGRSARRAPPTSGQEGPSIHRP